MNWENHTLDTMRRLHDDESYESWSRAIKNEAIKKFSNNLDDMLGRLASLVISEFEVPSMNKDKIIKILELAAVAGKTL